MKDIPIFVTESGTASLILREIPYKKTAFIQPRSVLPGGLAAMLDQCAAFCVQAGAERVLAEGADHLPPVCDVLELACHREKLPAPSPPVELERVRPDTFAQYREIANRLFREIPHAATCRLEDRERVLSRSVSFFALAEGCRAGVAELEGNELRTIGVLPEFHSLGYPFALTLLQCMEGPELTLRVSSDNARALRLYRRLGFTRRRVLSRWYLVRG